MKLIEKEFQVNEEYNTEYRQIIVQLKKENLKLLEDNKKKQVENEKLNLKMGEEKKENLKAIEAYEDRIKKMQGKCDRMAEELRMMENQKKQHEEHMQSYSDYNFT